MAARRLTTALGYHAAGFHPIPIRPGSKAPTITGWSTYCARQPTEGEIKAWWLQAPDAGIGHALGSLDLAVDVDVTGEPALQISIALQAHLGETPLVREGRPGRWLYLYRLGAPWNGDTKCGWGDLLTNRKQFVCDHIHPETGQPYRWLKADPLEVGIKTAPVVTPDQVRAFLAAVARELPEYAYSDFRQRTPSGSLEWKVDPQSKLVVDGRESFAARCVYRACIETDDPRGATAMAWEMFSRGADLTRPQGGNGRPYKPLMIENKVRSCLRKKARGLLSIYHEPLAATGKAPPLPQAEPDDDPAVAGRKVRAIVERWVAGEGPQRLALKATVGLGKTRQTLEALAPRIAAGETTHYYVSTIALGLENARNAGALGIPTAVIRGRDRPEDTADEGPVVAPDVPRLCRKHELADAVYKAGLSVADSLCEKKIDENTVERCEYFNTCPYRKQFSDCAGKLVIMAHQHLTGDA